MQITTHGSRLIRRFRPAAAVGLFALAACSGGAASAPVEPVANSPADASSASASAENPAPPGTVTAARTRGTREALATIVCPAASHDFGRVWQGAAVAHEFEFEAGGEAELVISDYRPDCGCTVAHLERVNADGTREPYTLKTPVPPGTRFALAASFDTTNREGPQAKTVRIYANVAGGARELAFQADVQPLLRVEPRVQSIVQMSVLERREVDFALSGVSGSPYTVTPLRAGLPDELEVTAEPIGPDADGRSLRWSVHAVLQPGMPKGIRSYELLLQTDIVNESAPPGPDGAPQPFVAKAMVSAVIAGLVSIEPQNLNFGLVAGDETVARTVTLASHDPSFELLEPTWELKPYKEGASEAFGKTLHVTTRRAENGRDWELELLLDGLATDVPRSFYGRLVIATGHPREPRLEITLSGLRRGS